MSKKKIAETVQSLALDKDEQLVQRYKRPTEHFLGFSRYTLGSLVLRCYEGLTSKPLKVGPMEQTIIKLLECRTGWSTDELCEVLGLDPEDGVERSLLQSGIDELRSERKQAIEGDETYIALTEKGRLFAQGGEVPEQYKSEFSLLYWREKPSILLPKEVADAVKNARYVDYSTVRSEFSLSKEEGLRVIEEQAPEVHYPRERYILDMSSLSFLGESAQLSYELAVALLYDTVIEEARLLLYDKDSYVVLRDLSEHLSQDKELVGCYVQEAADGVEERIQEMRMIYGEEPVEQCLTNSASEPSLSPEDGQQIKTLYDTQEFEEELGRILTDETAKAIWLISPWIKKGAFSRQRYKQIETFLSLSSNSQVRLIYSMPEGDSVMIDEISDELLHRLKKRYRDRLLIAQFPNFHYKEVIVEGVDGKLSIYSGSFNILSFSGQQQLNKPIRAERMTLLTNRQEIEQEYLFFLDNFNQYKLSAYKMPIGQTLNIKSLRQSLAQCVEEGQPNSALTEETIIAARKMVGPDYSGLKSAKELLFFLIGACCASVCTSIEEVPNFAKNKDVYLNTIMAKVKDFKALKIVRTAESEWVFEYEGIALIVQGFSPSSKALSHLSKKSREISNYERATYQDCLNELVYLLLNNDIII